MSVNKIKRRVLTGAVATAMAAALLTFAAPMAGAGAAEPTALAAAITVTPSTGLTDGAVVAVTATGLQAGTTYTIGQCGVVGDVFSCNEAELVTVSPAADGTASASLTVNKAFPGTVGPDGEPGPAVDCAVVECGVGMFNEVGDAAGTSISFA